MKKPYSFLGFGWRGQRPTRSRREVEGDADQWAMLTVTQQKEGGGGLAPGLPSQLGLCTRERKIGAQEVRKMG
jgi:hypothetical protein